MSKSIFTAIAVLILVAGTALAQTTTDVSWSGAGNVFVDFQSGNDMFAQFKTGGNLISGKFLGVDQDNNPYSYGVDTSTAFAKAEFAGGGYLEFGVKRQDSKSSMYGPAGQQTYSLVQSDDTGEMMFGVRTNFADMANGQYGWGGTYGWTTSGKNLEATGNYGILHSLTDADGDGAMVGANGSGSGQLKVMGEQSQGSSFNMASLPVCGDGAPWYGNYGTFSGTGTGTFIMSARADNGLTIGSNPNPGQFTIPGDGTNNSATFYMEVGYAGTWGWADIGMSGN